MSASAPIRVLHLSAADSMLYPILRDQLVFLRNLGYDIHTASIDGPLARRLRDEDKFPWSPLPLTREVAPWRDWKSLRYVEKFCRDGKFEIVHTHTPKGNLIGQWAARRAGVPIVLQTLHGFYFHERMRAPLRRLWVAIERFSAQHSDHVLCQNPEDVETAKKEHIAGPELISLLGNGIDLARFKPRLLSDMHRDEYRKKLGIPEEAEVVGMCGRFVAEKGYPEFFKAAGQLLARFPTLHLLVVGHKLESERVRGRFDPRDAGVPKERMTLLFDRDDMAELYACMDIHVLPSHREGFPRALMEGAASGLAQIATNIRGCRQCLEEGVTGFFVEVGDVAALAARLDALMTDPGLRERFGRAARLKAEKEFDQQMVFKRVAACYEKLIAAKLPGRQAPRAP